MLIYKTCYILLVGGKCLWCINHEVDHDIILGHVVTMLSFLWYSNHAERHWKIMESNHAETLKDNGKRRDCTMHYWHFLIDFVYFLKKVI